MPKAKIAGATSVAAPANGAITLDDIRNLILSMNAQNQATAAVAAKTKQWEPPAHIAVPNQRAYDSAPEWKPGALYWKTGSRPENAPAYLNG